MKLRFRDPVIQEKIEFLLSGFAMGAVLSGMTALSFDLLFNTLKPGQTTWLINPWSAAALGGLSIALGVTATFAMSLEKIKNPEIRASLISLVGVFSISEANQNLHQISRDPSGLIPLNIANIAMPMMAMLSLCRLGLDFYRLKNSGLENKPGPVSRDTYVLRSVKTRVLDPDSGYEADSSDNEL